MTLISPLGSISEGGSGPQSTRAQLAKGLPALYGLKLVEDLLLEYEPLISSLVVKFPDVRYVWNPKIYFYSLYQMINCLHEGERRKYLNFVFV